MAIFREVKMGDFPGLSCGTHLISSGIHIFISKYLFISRDGLMGTSIHPPLFTVFIHKSNASKFSLCTITLKIPFTGFVYLITAFTGIWTYIGIIILQLCFLEKTVVNLSSCCHWYWLHFQLYTFKIKLHFSKLGRIKGLIPLIGSIRD